MINYTKIKELFEKHSNNPVQINNVSLEYIFEEAKQFVSMGELSMVFDEVLSEYLDPREIQINNASLPFIYDNLEKELIMNEEIIRLDSLRKTN